VTSSQVRPAGGAFALYLVGFFGAWTAYVLWLYPLVVGLGEGSLALAAAGIGVRLLIWLAPVLLMLAQNDRVAPLRALGLVEHWQRGVRVGVALAVLLFAASWMRFGWPTAPYLTWSSLLGTSIGVGFFEEIPFRGYILQKLATRMNFWLANLLTSLLFVGVHLPGWLSLHLFSWPLAANNFVFGFVMGILFRITRSLWSCIITHDANDFVSFVLFHGR
jgi:membrane protease YdiL (CAAX protease family)